MTSNKQLLILGFLVIFSLTCASLTLVAEPTDEPEPEATMAETTVESEPETGATATIATPACTPTLPDKKPDKDAYATILEPLEVVAPSGNRIYGLIRRPDPDQYPDLCFPAVVLVPGGINPGRMMAYGGDAKLLAGSGMVVVTFNAEGRVDESPDDIRSEGEEDFNGFRHQDGLCALVEEVMALPAVMANNVGIATQSYGITMGAGCAGRHADIPIKYLVDGEGPPHSFVTCHGPRFLAGDTQKYEVVKEIFGRQATWQDSSQENLDWWYQREAVNFIDDFRGYYLRLQARWDHAQPPENEAEIPNFHHPGGWPGGGPSWWHNKHSTDIVNAAVEGGVPWVRVNLTEQGNPVNAKYDADQMPAFLPGELADRPWSVMAILEMVRMPAFQNHE